VRADLSGAPLDAVLIKTLTGVIFGIGNTVAEHGQPHTHQKHALPFFVSSVRQKPDRAIRLSRNLMPRRRGN